MDNRVVVCCVGATYGAPVLDLQQTELGTAACALLRQGGCTGTQEEKGQDMHIDVWYNMCVYI